MNDQANYTSPSVDTVLSATMVGGLAASGMLLAAAYCAQALVA